MSRQISRPLLLAAGSLLALGLAACSGTADDLLDPILPEREAAYKSSKTAPPLEVPPDLSSATLNDTMVVPSLAQGSATYSAYANGTQVALAGVDGVLPRLDGLSQPWIRLDALISVGQRTIEVRATARRELCQNDEISDPILAALKRNLVLDSAVEVADVNVPLILGRFSHDGH